MYRLTRLRRWALEDKALQGLGGPPNNWRASPEYKSRQHGMSTGHEWYSIAFGNDACDIHILTKYSDGTEDIDLVMLAAEDFRKLALWYLWRWVWGEWCGLRRRLFYSWSRRTTLQRRQNNV